MTKDKAIGLAYTALVSILPERFPLSCSKMSRNDRLLVIMSAVLGSIGSDQRALSSSHANDFTSALSAISKSVSDADIFLTDQYASTIA